MVVGFELVLVLLGRLDRIDSFVESCFDIVFLFDMYVRLLSFSYENKYYDC